MIYSEEATKLIFYEENETIQRKRTLMSINKLREKRKEAATKKGKRRFIVSKINEDYKRTNDIKRKCE